MLLALSGSSATRATRANRGPRNRAAGEDQTVKDFERFWALIATVTGIGDGKLLLGLKTLRRRGPNRRRLVDGIATDDMKGVQT